MHACPGGKIFFFCFNLRGITMVSRVIFYSTYFFFFVKENLNFILFLSETIMKHSLGITASPEW